MNYFIKSSLSFIYYIFHLITFAFMFIISRIPILVLIVLLFLQTIDFATFLITGMLSIIGTAYMVGYRKGKTFIHGICNVLWRYFLRPITYLIFIDLAYIAIATTATGSSVTDWWILAAILALFMMQLFIRIFYKNPPKEYNTLIPRTNYVRYTIFLLWIYTLLIPDNLSYIFVAIGLIYILEFISYVPLNQKKQSYVGKILLGENNSKGLVI